MKTTPILYTAPMVQAVINDTKTQTRRLNGLQEINKNPDEWTYLGTYEDINTPAFKDGKLHGFRNKHNQRMFVKCPYGQPGDILWVRETYKVGAWNHEDFKVAFDYKASPELTKTPWYRYELIDDFEAMYMRILKELDTLGIEPKIDEENEKVYYKWEPGQSPFKWKPNIHMPKAACRLFLKIKSIRVERLQNISEADAIAEGIENLYANTDVPPTYRNYMDKNGGWDVCANDAVESYKTLWQKINGPESWDANPYVWVVDFEKTDKPNGFQTHNTKT